MAERPNHLRSLNDAQYSAVTHDPSVPLQILAGPGSGKTRTLTYRIAHIIDVHGIPPSNIVAVTFTNKAANELRVRLDALIGRTASSSLILGTFHSICGRLLRKHGAAIQVPTNFSICDADESQKIINGILKNIVASSGAHASGSQKLELKDKLALELISKAKAKGLDPEQLEAKVRRDIQANVTVPKGEVSPQLMLQLLPVYSEYIEECKRHNALDFDDLLAYGVKLLKSRPDCVDCRHVFVDEFQDTNTIQFELMAQLAGRKGNVSVVGDPDQSIYGWRSAEIENLRKMTALFPRTRQIFLEDNYRSTGAILAASVAIISEDINRPPKTLRTSHPFGFVPTLGSYTDEREEAAFIADEIKRLKLVSGGMLKWSDFAILLRFNALSRNLEQALQKEGIPSRVLAGQKFFERIEVKDLLAYLQLIDNPDFDPAILRIINVPKRNIGNKSIEELQKRARGKKQPVMQIVERIVDGRIPDVSPPLQGKAKRLVHSLRKLRRLAREGMPVHTLIQELVTELNYADHLMKTQPDWETRWENVRELITFATEPNSNGGPGTEAPSAAPDTEPVIIEEGEEFSVPVTPATEPEQFLGEPKTVFKATKGATSEESELAEGIDEAAGYDVQIITPLRHFLQTTSLSTDATVNDDESQGEKVVISTCHAAKGLEWPVVFIPSVEQGTFPFYRSDDVEEERRLLYVACTRAQIMLYLTHANKRKLGGESKATGLSDYLKDVLKKGPKGTFADTRPTVGYKEFSVLCKVIERDAPDPKAVEEGVRSYCKSRPQTTQPTSSAPVSYPSSGSAYRIPVGHQSQTVVHSAVFSTARAVVGTLPQVQVIGTSRTTSSTPLVRPSEQQPTSFTTIPTRKQHPTFVPNPVSSSSSSHKPESVRESVQKEGVLHAETTKYRFKKPMGSEGTPSASGTATQGVLSRNGVNGLGEVPAVSASVRVSISTHGSSAVVQSAVPRPEEVPPKVVGTKRRLGMTARVSKFPRNV